VLCAKEFQPGPERYLGTQIVRAPMNDVQITDDIAETAHAAASEALDLYRQGASVLVTCAWGKNRSGLVTGLMLVGEGYSGEEAVRLIQNRRPGSLFNESFANYLRSF
jgi:protein-tyrosine phosphatase